MRSLLALLLFWTVSCGDTGRDHVSLPLFARGSAARPVQLGPASVLLTRADVWFGPAYLCASEQARAELCEVAIAELREVAQLNALDPSSQPLGALEATTGSVRSGLFDYGISWLLTETQPRALSASGHSARLEGSVERAGQTLRFSAVIDVKPRARGEAAVNGQRSEHEISGDEQVILRVDPQRWVDRLDADALFALPPGVDGAVTIEPGTPNHESILQGMVSRAPVAVGWE